MATRQKVEDWLDGDNLLLLEGWARDGLIDQQIADNIGISKSTLYVWKRISKEFSNSLKRNKDIVDREVENSLLKRAMGYEYTEVTRERNGSGDMVETKRVTKQVVPDTTAIIFWLKNRKPNDYRDKRDLEVAGIPSVVIHDDVTE